MMDWLAILGGGGTPPGPEALILLVLPLGLLLLLAVVFGGGGARRQMSRRIDRIKLDYASGPPTTAQIINARRSKGPGTLQTLDRLAKKFVPRQDVLRQRLASAGLECSLASYVLVSAFVAILGLGLAQISGFMPTPAALLFAAFCGLGLPHAYVGFRAKRRRIRFIAYFPEAIDLMVRGVRAGLPIAESIKAAGEEVPDPVGTELKRITDSVRLGRKLDEVLWEASKRLNLQEFKFFAIALSIQSETGGNLAETLNNLSDVLRSRRQLKRKIKALSSEAKASAYIIGSLPFIMCVLIYLVNSEYIMRLVTDVRGNIMIGFGLVMIAAGVGIMYRMVKFEI